MTMFRDGLDELRLLPAAMPSSGRRVRLVVQYREVGSGPESVEVEWEDYVPDCAHLAALAQVLLRGRDEEES